MREPGRDREAEQTRIAFRGSWSGYERDRMFVNPGFQRAFVDAAYLLGLDLDDDGRASVPVDIDGDGDLDIAVLSLQGLHLLENRLPRRHFARIRLAAARGEPCGLESLVTVEAGGVRRRSYARLTEGFMSQVPGDLHFGLGDAASIDRVTVKWPDGSLQDWKGLPADRLIVLRQGQEGAGVFELAHWSDQGRPRPVAGFRRPGAVELLTGGSRELAKDRPAIIQFWSPSCQSCVQELEATHALAKRMSPLAEWVFLSVDPRENDEARQALGKVESGGTEGVASEAILSSFFGTAGAATVPSTFIFDASGRLVRGFSRTAGGEEIAEVLDSLNLHPGFARDYALLGRAALAKYEYEEAEKWLRESLRLDPDAKVERYSLAVALIGQKRYEEALAELRSVLQSDPDYSAEAWSNLGSCLRSLHRPAEALDAFAQALRVRGRDDDFILVGAAGAAAEADNLGLALDYSDRAVRAAPESFSACLAAAKVRLVRKEFRDGERLLLRAIALSPENKEARELLAAIRRGNDR